MMTGCPGAVGAGVAVGLADSITELDDDVLDSAVDDEVGSGASMTVEVTSALEEV